MRSRTSRQLLRVGDVIASIALVVSLRSGERRVHERRPYAANRTAWLIGDDRPRNVGRVLWQLALAEERFVASHDRYAPHASYLDVTLPDGWKATVLVGSARRYQVRLETEDVSCLLWGNRTPGRPLEEFNVNCAERLILLSS